MENRQNLLHEKTELLQEFLKATQSIGQNLTDAEAPEALELIQEKVAERDRVITRVKVINEELAKLGEPTGGQKTEQDKQTWLWQQILEQVQALEDENTSKLKGLMTSSMEKARSATDSIRVIDAYSRQMPEEETRNVDKSK